MQTGKMAAPSLRDVLRILFKRKLQILLFFGFTVIAVATVSLVVKPTYQAAAQILIKVGRENIYVPTLPAGGSAPPVISVNREEQLNSEIEILKSQFLAERVVASLGPAVIYPALGSLGEGWLRGWLPNRGVRQSPSQRAVTQLLKNLTVEGVKRSDVISARFRHHDPQMAATVINRLVSIYVDRHLEVFQSPQGPAFFQEQVRLLKTKLSQSEDRLETFKRKHDLTSLEEQRALLLRNEAERRSALYQTLNQEAETEDRLRQLREQLAAIPKTIPLEEGIEYIAEAISVLQARLVELELREQELVRKYTDQNRSVQGIRDEIQLVRKKLAEQESKGYRRSRTGVNPVHQALQQDLLRNEAELKALRAKRENQAAQQADYQKRLDTFRGIEVPFIRLQQEVELDRQNYRLYLTKLEESRISDAMDREKMANVSLIEPAQPPLKPVSPKLFLNIVLAFILGAVGALGIAFFSEYLSESLERPEDVEHYLHLPVLASIPEHT